MSGLSSFAKRFIWFKATNPHIRQTTRYASINNMVMRWQLVVAPMISKTSIEYTRTKYTYKSCTRRTCFILSDISDYNQFTHIIECVLLLLLLFLWLSNGVRFIWTIALNVVMFKIMDGTAIDIIYSSAFVYSHSDVIESLFCWLWYKKTTDNA